MQMQSWIECKGSSLRLKANRKYVNCEEEGGMDEIKKKYIK